MVFICSITEMMREKDKRLRQGLSVMGLTSTAFWFSWFFTMFIINFVVTVIMMFSGMAFGFDFFLKTPFLYVIVDLKFYYKQRPREYGIKSAC